MSHRSKTIIEGVRERRERAARLRREGLCITCETSPVTTNADGTTSVRCVGCKAKQTPKIRTSIRTAAKTPPPRKIDEWGTDTETYLDTVDFKVFCVQVLAVMPKLVVISGDPKKRLRDLKRRKDSSFTIGDFRRNMGERFNERRIHDALDNLKGAGLIVEEWGVPTRYSRREPPVKKSGWDKTIYISPNTRPLPDASVYSDPRRRVMA